MANDHNFISRVAAANKRMGKSNVRSAQRWADNIVKQRDAEARANRSCVGCGNGMRVSARFCESCGKEAAA